MKLKEVVLIKSNPTLLIFLCTQGSTALTQPNMFLQGDNLWLADWLLCGFTVRPPAGRHCCTGWWVEGGERRSRGAGVCVGDQDESQAVGDAQQVGWTRNGVVVRTSLMNLQPVTQPRSKWHSTAPLLSLLRQRHLTVHLATSAIYVIYLWLSFSWHLLRLVYHRPCSGSDWHNPDANLYQTCIWSSNHSSNTPPPASDTSSSFSPVPMLEWCELESSSKLCKSKGKQFLASLGLCRANLQSSSLVFSLAYFPPWQLKWLGCSFGVLTVLYPFVVRLSNWFQDLVLSPSIPSFTQRLTAAA